MTYLKTGVNIEFQDFLRGIFVIKAKVKEYVVFYKAIINHIPNNIRNFKLINLKNKINISIIQSEVDK